MFGDFVKALRHLSVIGQQIKPPSDPGWRNGMVQIEERVIIRGYPCGKLVIKPGNVVLLRILVPLFKRAERIVAVDYVR
jgi:hypothetical protein